MSEDYAAPFLDALRAFIEVLEANPRDDDRIVAARKVLIDATSRFYHHVPVERINEVEKFYKFNSVAVHNYVTPHYLVPPQLLPVPTMILRRLREFYADFGGEPLYNGPWSEVDTPTRWAKRFGYTSAATFIRHVKVGAIRAKKLSDRSYRVAVEDVPRTESAP